MNLRHLFFKLPPPLSVFVFTELSFLQVSMCRGSRADTVASTVVNLEAEEPTMAESPSCSPCSHPIVRITSNGAASDPPPAKNPDGSPS